jgi:hypothetical protein
MGYYASLVKGDPFYVTDPTPVLDYLDTERVSWCRETFEYRASKQGRTLTSECAALTDLLNDYGFDVFHEQPGDGSDDYVLVNGWRGDKLGGSWDTVWEAFTLGVAKDTEVFWIMLGEDHEAWCEHLQRHDHNTRAVDMVVRVS